MAQIFVCDGCDSTQKKDVKFETIGIVNTKDYCPKCAKIAKDYIQQRDALHDNVREVWMDGIKELNKKFKEKINAIPA